MEASIEDLNAKGLLWHYTTWNGLVGIIEDEVLWASNYRYLNDEREVTFAFDLFSAVNRAESDIQWPEIKPPPFVAMPKRDWRMWNPIWVASVSKHCDSLSQWRAYSGGTSGIAVGFTHDVLQKAADEFKTNGFETKFVRCLYRKEDHDAIIAPLAQPLINSRRDGRAIETNPASDNEAGTMRRKDLGTSYKNACPSFTIGPLSSSTKASKMKKSNALCVTAH